MDFENTLQHLESILPFFTLLSSYQHQGENAAILRYQAMEDKYQLAKYGIKNFDDIYYSLLDSAKAIDKHSWDVINQIDSRYQLLHHIGEINAYTEAGININSIDLQKLHNIVTGVNRLISLTKRLERLNNNKFLSDDEIFKPSNIDIDQIVTYLENTISEVQDNAIIPPSQKTKLIQYLSETKNELAKDKKPWKKIIGALVITATILSGIASAPKAYENVKSAINHIIGTSVEQHIPLTLTPDPMAKERGLDEVV